VGFDTSVTAEAIRALLAAAIRLVPSLAGARVTATWAGLRPRTPDDRPILGRILGRAAPGLVIATGHFRDGILLAPISGAIVAALVLGETPPVDLAPFAVDRF
jgi:glycine oxidase